jgi:subtilase family protein
MRRSPLAAAVALAVAGALGAWGAALAAPAGLPLGRTLPGHQSLIVEFADHPSLAAVERRLGGLGPVHPVVSEVGVWGVRPRRPLTARERALGRFEVRSAQWSLERGDDSFTPKATTTPAPGVEPTSFTDPFFSVSDQWDLFAPSPTFWDPKLTGFFPRPPLAILDGGIDSSHEEWSGPDSPIVDPHSTYQDSDTANDWGQTGHGTHVAGIAAAPANGVGIVGVAPAEKGVAPVIPVQIADAEGRSTDETMMEGIRWAVLHRARVINISAGGPGYSQAFQDVVDWAFSRGTLIVASVGNEGEDTNDLNYPAAYDHVLGVGAMCDTQVDPPDCPAPFATADFSNHNRSVDMVAPGVNILSSVPKRVHDRQVAPGYALKDGTSMAAPYVSGVAELVFAKYPDATPYQVMRQLENTATHPPGGGRNNQSGWGVVNAEAAVDSPLPVNDPGEVNDNVAKTTGTATLQEAGQPRSIDARADFYDDPDDVYPVRFRRGDRVELTLSYRRGLFGLYLWRPGTQTVGTRARAKPVSRAVAASTGLGREQSVTVTVRRSGRYYVDVNARQGGGQYKLVIDRLTPGSR